MCEVTGADIREVSRAIGADSRIGSKFLNSGPGFGGSCFKKDILNLVYLSKFFGLPEVAEFWESVVSLNNWNQSRISEMVVKKLFGTVSGKKIAILGFSFKANTNDTRESAAIQICKDLLDEGAILSIHDPKVSEKQIEYDLDKVSINHKNNIRHNELNQIEGSWQKFDNLYDCFKNANATILLTEWQEYSKINWATASKSMRHPAWVFDSRSVVDPKVVRDTKLNLWRVGDGS